MLEALSTGVIMPYFVLLQKYTDQGRKAMRDTPANIKRNIENIAGTGIKTPMVFLTLGEYDIVAIGEFPSDDAALALVAKLAEQGNAVSTVLRAFTLDEAEQVFSR